MPAVAVEVVKLHHDYTDHLVFKLALSGFSRREMFNFSNHFVELVII